MPIGLSKVPFRSPGEEDASWVDVRVMIHQPASSFYEAQMGEFILEAEELLNCAKASQGFMYKELAKPLWVVSEDMERDIFMSAIEAQAYGIVDLVAVD